MVRTAVLIGAIAMIVGIVMFVLFVGTAANCGSDTLAELNSCQRGNLGLHVGFGLIVSGAAIVVGGTIASVRRDARLRSKKNPLDG